MRYTNDQPDKELSKSYPISKNDDTDGYLLVPRLSRCIRPPPPKNMSKMSMGDAKPPPPPPPPLPPSLMAFSPPRSYTSLFWLSDRTSYACEICLNYKTHTQKQMYTCKLQETT